MLTIIHGNDVVTSRKYYLDQKNESSITFDAESIEISEITHSLQGGGLFGPSKKIFIDNLFSRKSSKNFDAVLESLRTADDAEIYIWADKEIGVKILSAFPKHVVQSFKISQNIFGFLDSLRPNSPSNVSRFHDALNSSETEIVFAMIVRQFRLMIGLSEESGLPAGEAGKNIDEVKRLAPWQKSKLIKQASAFGKEKLLIAYKKLYKIDKAQKTGSSNLNLLQNIDILLLEI
ncbi:MAG: hypothetical protein ACD_37C00173G0001 [uncultured bacterium]|nr:MAG: hypothetical protein ACD_37C00173G0001 [uncultured bacterium]